MDVDERNGASDAAWRCSQVARALRRLFRGFDAATGSSRTVAVAHRVEAIGRSSRLYRWCVTEPEPRVVRIDLRDSRLLGPVAGRVPRLHSAIDSAWQNGRTRRDWRTVAEPFREAPVRTASALALLLVVGSAIAAWQRPTPVATGHLAIAAGLALLGLRDGRSAVELRDTRVGRLLVVIFAPPEDGQR